MPRYSAVSRAGRLSFAWSASTPERGISARLWPVDQIHADITTGLWLGSHDHLCGDVASPLQAARLLCDTYDLGRVGIVTEEPATPTPQRPRA